MKETKIQITQAELQAAIRKFIEAGGLIQKLPEQKTAGSRMVGRRWSSTEMEGDSN